MAQAVFLLQGNIKELSAFNTFKPLKMTISLPHYGSDKGFKDTVVNLTICPFNILIRNVGQILNSEMLYF